MNSNSFKYAGDLKSGDFTAHEDENFSLVEVKVTKRLYFNGISNYPQNFCNVRMGRNIFYKIRCVKMATETVKIRVFC